MKKLYMLIMATLIVATASAQTAVQNVKFPKGKIVTAPMKQAKGMADEMWMNYATFDLLSWNPNATSYDYGYYWTIQSDTLGWAVHQSSTQTQVMHPWVYSISQTYDLNSYFYDQLFAGLYGEGNSMSLTASTLNLDSLELVCDYLRSSNMDPSIIDTLIIGIALEDREQYSYWQSVPNSCFYDFTYDLNTNSVVTDKVYRIPLGPDDAADDEHYSVIDLPLNLTNINEKVWNVSISFKRGYDVALNDTLQSTFGLMSVTSQDPDYYVGDDDANPTDDAFRCENMSHGGFVWKYLVNVLGDESYYYPGFMFDDISHFVYGLYLKVSCEDCEVVNVPEIEKNNPTIYPNPATNNFTVNLGNDEKAFIQLFNIVGQEVMSETITGTAQVNVANLNPGVYMLKINQNGNSYTTKVIVK